MDKSIKYRDYRDECRRGQIETFGLAFIIVLISIGFFIFVSFKSQQKQDNPQKEFTNDKLASDFALAILDVSVDDCREFTVQDLIIDCGRDHRINCVDANACCGDSNSCVALNKSIGIMLNKTFVVRNTKFRFYSENLIYEGNELLNFTNLNCTASSSQGRAGEARIPLYPVPTNVYLTLNICYQ
jgi:hypothetical protein